MIYDKLNKSFKNKIEGIQYKACLAITGTIQGPSRERIYQELRLESLCDRCRFENWLFLKGCAGSFSVTPRQVPKCKLCS